MKVTIDGAGIVTEQDFHAQLAIALDAQNFYGYNLDALWDLLSAGVERPLLLIWKNHNYCRKALGSRFDAIIKVLDSVRQQDESLGFSDKFSYILD